MRIAAMILLALLTVPCLAMAGGRSVDQHSRFDEGSSATIALSKEQQAGKSEYVDDAAAEKFIRQWLLLSEKDDRLDAVMGLYGDSVRFYKFGVVDKAFIRNDKEKYYTKWLQRTYSWRKLEAVHSGGNKASRMFDLSYHFKINNSKDVLEGDAKVRLALSQRQGVITITREEGRVVKKDRRPKARMLEPAPTSKRALIKWLQNAWKAHRNVEEVKAQLAAGPWPNGAPTMWQSADLDGDGSDEWLITVNDTDKTTEMYTGGEFWIVNGKGLAYKYRAQHVGAPAVEILTDLTGDGLPDVLLVAPGCGASTCFAEYEVISAHGGHMRSIGSFEMTSEEKTKLTADKPPAVVIKGGTATSAAAGGAQREYAEIWAWNGSTMILKETIWDKTNWRHHVLYDGIFSQEKGDYASAIESYSRVINETSLKNAEAWDGRTGKMVSSYGRCRQFAAFRLVLLYLQRDNVTKATKWRDWLKVNYPAEPMTGAAKKFVDDWSLSKDLKSACRKVTELLKAEDRPTWPLNDLGNNLQLKAEDVCPTQYGSSFVDQARRGW